MSSGSGSDNLILQRDPSSVRVKKVAPKASLVFVPFSLNLVHAQPGDGDSSAKVTVTVENKGAKQVYSFWACAMTEEAGDAEADPPVLPSIVPYWWLTKKTAPQSGFLPKKLNALLKSRFLLFRDVC